MNNHTVYDMRRLASTVILRDEDMAIALSRRSPIWAHACEARTKRDIAAVRFLGYFCMWVKERKR